MCFGQLVERLKLSLVRCNIISLQPFALRSSRALLPAGTSGWLCRLYCPALDTIPPDPGGTSPCPIHQPFLKQELVLVDQGTKKANTEQVVVLLVGWFPLAVLSVLTAVFCCGGETALPSPWTTLCQQEVLTREIKYNICLKWLIKEKCFLLECSLCLGMGNCEHQYFCFHICVEQHN